VLPIQWYASFVNGSATPPPQPVHNCYSSEDCFLDSRWKKAELDINGSGRADGVIRTVDGGGWTSSRDKCLLFGPRSEA